MLHHSCLETGKMPVPQENSSLVEQARCLFLTMVQDVSFLTLLALKARGFLRHFDLNIPSNRVPRLTTEST